MPEQGEGFGAELADVCGQPARFTVRNRASASGSPDSSWPSSPPSASRARWNAASTGSPAGLSLGIAIRLYGLSEAGTHGGFGRPAPAAATLAGLVLIGLYGWHAVVRGPDALVDLTLLRRRGFGTAAAINVLLPVALFGSLILIPLYYQVIRQAGPVQIGLLLAPQGIGAELALPVAGLLTDKIGARAVCSAGLLLALLGTLGYTQLGAHTSDAYLAAGLFVIGAGIGSTIAPSMAAAFTAVPPAEMPRATTALNTLQRIAGALGTALFAILLQHSMSASQASHPGGVTAVARAFGGTFWVAAALIAAALLLPRPGKTPGSSY